ncbi:hypothetical protein PISL3812_08350 [Talaromyces islandicus]|uniref:Uncharacterized protein n=1 Tax=Talaromyces islandicus TaxID=28573 RepID=A0A0U1M7H0_TALIS|nr:hypothetical protein PISL3812_08350 [Talaromyces islandicus]
MGAIESTMTSRDNTKPKRNRKNDKAERDSIQSFYSANEQPEIHDDGYYHLPEISPEEAAWSSSLEQQNMAGRLDETFSLAEEHHPDNPRHSSRLDTPFTVPSEYSPAEPQPSSNLDAPFPVPDSWNCPVETQVSGRLDAPFSEYAEDPFASTLSSYGDDDKKSTRSRKGKYRPESSTSLNSQITRGINNYHGDEPAPTLQSPFHPHYDDVSVPLPLNTRGKHPTGTRLTKKKIPLSGISPPPPPPSRPPPPAPPPRLEMPPPQEQKSRRYLSKRQPLPPSLPLQTSSHHKFSGSGSGHGYGYGDAGPDISSLSGDVLGRPLEKKKQPSIRGVGSKGCHGESKSTDDKPPVRRPEQQQQQQQLRHTRDPSISPVSPVSPGHRDSPVSPISPLTTTEDDDDDDQHHRGDSQESEKSPVSFSQGRGNSDSEVQVLQPTKLKPERIFFASPSRWWTPDAESDSDTEADSTLRRPDAPKRGQFTGRFEFELEIPVATHETTVIEECLRITEFDIYAVVDKHRHKKSPSYLTCTSPSFCYRMDNNPAKTTIDRPKIESDDDMSLPSTKETCKVRYYGFVRDLLLPRNMAECCKICTTFRVDYSPNMIFKVTLEDWEVDVSWVASVREQ